MCVYIIRAYKLIITHFKLIQKSVIEKLACATCIWVIMKRNGSPNIDCKKIGRVYRSGSRRRFRCCDWSISWPIKPNSDQKTKSSFAISSNITWLPGRTSVQGEKYSWNMKNTFIYCKQLIMFTSLYVINVTWYSILSDLKLKADMELKLSKYIKIPSKIIFHYFLQFLLPESLHSDTTITILHFGSKNSFLKNLCPWSLKTFYVNHH